MSRRVSSARLSRCCAAIAFGLLTPMAPMQADDRFWIDTAGGSFTDTGNWSTTSGGVGGATVPVVGDNAIFDQAGTYSVTLSANRALDLLDVDAGTITFDSTGGVQTYDLLTGDADALFVGSDVTIDGTNLNIGDDFSVADGTMLVQGGSDITAGDTASIATGTGDAIVTFNASSFDFGGRLRLALSGLDGTLNLQNGSTGNIDGDLEFVRSGTLGSGGFLNVSSASTLTTGGTVLVGDIFSNGSPSYNAFLTVEDANSMFTMNGANNLRVGDSAFDNVNAELRVRNGGTFASGVGGGNIIVQRTGLIAVESGGTFTARNDLLVNQTGEVTVTNGTLNTAAQFVIDATSSVTLDGGAINAGAGLDNSAGGTLNHHDGTLTVTGGSFTPNAGGNFTIRGASGGDNPHLVLGAGGTGTVDGFLIVGDSGQAGELTLIDGGVFNVDVSSLIGNSSMGKVTVDGENSSLMTTSQITVGNGGVGEMNIQNGGTVSSSLGGINGTASSTSTVNIDGVGSSWTLNFFFMGNGMTALNITNGGTLSTLSISPGNIGTGSEANAAVMVTGQGSSWTTSAGLNVGGTFSDRSGALSVTDGGLVDVGGTLLIREPGTVTLDRSTLVTQSIDNSLGGVFEFFSGALTINDGLTIGNDPQGVFPTSFEIDFTKALGTAGTTTVSANHQLLISGGTLTTGGLTVNGSFQFSSGTLELTGGIVAGLSQLVVPSSGVLLAQGTTIVPLTAIGGSQITATGSVSLGDATSTSGFYSNGQVHVADNVVTLLDANDAVFDSGAAVDLGDAGTGEVDAAGGLTLDFGGNITGFGTIDTPDNAATPLINNGNITGNSTDARITLTGFVKGVGTCDNCNITGTDSPGFSPATVNRGSVSYNGTLEIEIGGTAAGSFDKLNHILGAGIADLGGTLDVLLINGFTPSAGDMFEIITAADVQNAFAVENFPTVAGLDWNIAYNPTSVVLSLASAGLPGDFNADGTVNAADYTVWRDNLGAANESALNGNGDGLNGVDAADYALWQTNFGATSGATLRVANVLAVPEPAACILALVGTCLAVCRRGGQKSRCGLPTP